ncbi:hypothetical protein FJ251_07875 [bacterium]|nr:hypothetical protein [bacterium]
MKRWGWVLLAMVFAFPVLAAESAPPPMQPALLVIDVQNAFLPYMAEQDKRIAPLTVNGAI